VHTCGLGSFIGNAALAWLVLRGYAKQITVLLLGEERETTRNIKGHRNQKELDNCGAKMAK